MLNWNVWDRTDNLEKMVTALDSLQRLICYKIRTANQPKTLLENVII